MWCRQQSVNHQELLCSLHCATTVVLREQLNFKSAVIRSERSSCCLLIYSLVNRLKLASTPTLPVNDRASVKFKRAALCSYPSQVFELNTLTFIGYVALLQSRKITGLQVAIAYTFRRLRFFLKDFSIVQVILRYRWFTTEGYF